MFDFSDAGKQKEMGVAIPGGSIVACKIKIDDACNDKGVKRNRDNNKDMFSCSLEVVSDPFQGATIFDHQTVKVDNPKAKGAKQNLNIGRAAMRGLIDSVAGLSEDDDSPAAMKKRAVPHLRVLDGRICVVKTKLEPNQNGKEYAKVAKYMTKGEDGYEEAKNGTSHVGDIEPKQHEPAQTKANDDWGTGDTGQAEQTASADDWSSDVSTGDQVGGDAGAVPDWAG